MLARLDDLLAVNCCLIQSDCRSRPLLMGRGCGAKSLVCTRKRHLIAGAEKQEQSEEKSANKTN
eukprot:6197947-Pleurochrysis_carterae.AAC.1